MSDTVEIHPTTPQPRLIVQVAAALASGQIVVVPTDSGYALACRLADKSALARIAQIRQDDEPHHMTMICRDLSEISTYAKLDNVHYRFLKAHTPGPFTFILAATNEVPRRLLHPKKRSIGLRVPQHPILQAIVQETAAPILSASLVLPGVEEPMEDPDLFPKAVERQVDLIVHCGFLVQMPSTVIDMTGSEFSVSRVGLGGVPPELED